MGGARRSGRIARELPILLCATSTNGQFFSEETKTVVLSRHGAGIFSKFKLAPDEPLTIRLLPENKEAQLRLVGQMGEEAGGFTYGVEFLDPQLEFWGIDFPPVPQIPAEPENTFECTLCHERQPVRQTEIESDVYALLQNILRHCPNCGFFTPWREATGNAPPSRPQPKPGFLISPAPPSPPPLPSAFLPAVPPASPSISNFNEPAVVFADSSSEEAPSAYAADTCMALVGRDVAIEEAFVNSALPASTPARPSSPPASPALPQSASSPAPRPSSNGKPANRRKHLRSRVNFTAQIRHPALGIEIAECDDISKGGFSFRSRKSYPEGCQIEVALPYTPGWDAAFVPATIQHTDALPGGSLFRYGAAYVPRPKSNTFKP